MSPVAVTVLCGLIAGFVLVVCAWRWPTLSAPRVSPGKIVDEAAQHPSVERVLASPVKAAEVSELALGAALVAMVAGGALIGIVLFMVRSHTGLANYDLRAARWGAAHATSGSTQILRNISLLGGTVGSIVVALVVAVLAVAFRRLPVRGVVSFLVVVMVGQTVLVNVIKVIVDRTRPDIDRLTGFAGPSFPSGHAATTAATFACAALLLGYSRGRVERAALTGVAAGIAVAVATTRVLLGVHWLTDVVAGLLLGWTWFAVVSIAFGGRLLRFAEPVEAAERVAVTTDV
jgi:membrane-associated phospholipid phosphatase